MAWSADLTQFAFYAICAAIQSYFCCVGIRGLKTETEFKLIMYDLVLILIPVISISATLADSQ